MKIWNYKIDIRTKNWSKIKFHVSMGSGFWGQKFIPYVVCVQILYIHFTHMYLKIFLFNINSNDIMQRKYILSIHTYVNSKCVFAISFLCK